MDEEAESLKGAGARISTAISETLCIVCRGLVVLLVERLLSAAFSCASAAVVEAVAFIPAFLVGEAEQHKQSKLKCLTEAVQKQ
eukprot:gene2161-8021_t